MGRFHPDRQQVNRSRERFRFPKLTAVESNIAEAMQGVPEFIVERQLGHFGKVHPDYAAGVPKALAEQAKKAKAAK